MLVITFRHILVFLEEWAEEIGQKAAHILQPDSEPAVDNSDCSVQRTFRVDGRTDGLTYRRISCLESEQEGIARVKMNKSLETL